MILFLFLIIFLGMKTTTSKEKKNLQKEEKETQKEDQILLSWYLKEVGGALCEEHVSPEACADLSFIWGRC